MDSDQLALAFLEKREARSGKRRARSDPVALPTEKLLATLLGPAAERVCEELTEAYGGLRRLAAIHPLELRERGLKPAAVERLRTVFELARRFGEEEFPPGAFFRGSYDVYAHFRERLAAETVEYFVAVPPRQQEPETPRRRRLDGLPHQLDRSPEGRLLEGHSRLRRRGHLRPQPSFRRYAEFRIMRSTDSIATPLSGWLSSFGARQGLPRSA